MKKHNPTSERIKRKYFAFLKEAKRHSEPTVDATAKALSRFEVYTGYRDFKAFHIQQAIAFKRHLAEQKGQQTGEKLSKATLCSRPSPKSNASFSGWHGNQATSPGSSMPMPSISMPAFRISIPTASETPLSNSAKRSARLPNSSRRGARTWDMRKS
jgi:hypothetical protein